MKTIKGTLEYGRFSIPWRKYGEHEHMFVCVSGALQTMAVWRSVVKRFTSDFSVIVFDMPGVGRSEILSGDAHVPIEDQLETLHAVIQEVHTGGTVTLAGSSWGTAVAAAYASRHPEMVHQLVLSSFGMKPNAVMEGLVERAIDLYHSGDWHQGADIILEMFGQQIGDAYKRQIVNQFKNLTASSAESFYEHCRNILDLGSLDEVVDLSAITARTMIINGAEDRIIDLADMRVAEQLIPDCTCMLIDDVGHFLHFERPELLEYYMDFLVPGLPAPA